MPHPAPRQLLEIVRKSPRPIALEFPSHGEANRYRLRVYGDRRKFFRTDTFLAQSTFSLKGHPVKNRADDPTLPWLMVAEGPQESIDLSLLQLLDPETGEQIPTEELVGGFREDLSGADLEALEDDDQAPWNLEAAEKD